MAGIYVHIPFCKQACHYCDFHFSTTTSYQQELVESLTLELQLTKDYLSGEAVSSIYFGGGTPSLVGSKAIESIINKIYNLHAVEPTAEVTLEANPDDLNSEMLGLFKSAGINRLSVGIQSFLDEDLKLLNRAHNSAEASQCIGQIREAGFENFTCDLIYGLPNQTLDMWSENIDRLLAFKPNHVSFYCLTIEPKTVFDKWTRDGKIAEADEDLQSDMFLLARDRLKAAGYDHYEVSNYALPGFESRHNSSYWKGANYLGIGPSAHSFNGSSRSWNIANNRQYMTAIQEANLPSTVEEIDTNTAYNEYVLTTFRTKWGADSDTILERFGDELHAYFLAKAIKHLAKGVMVQENGNFKLTSEGLLMADGIASDIFTEPSN